ncbi:hypothetical protein Xbed_01764 [Xenorhabdus beddingii]|uniref:Uncharacterized protein n=1 Tax=Xenorhabdus beddingii TaxID=40578 RepID=A0A1Y2SPR9_9GAMM|nr:DKNYY domain-containing protein [Xenorhabdus beddingii]OTA20049.1 hypothetical protein Xbed_01764 [Xenorhabdus beddingii]
MAEPQFLFGSIPLSRAAFDRWLKSVPPSANDWHDWSDATFWENSDQQTVAQALVPYFTAEVDMQRCMLIHDKTENMLRCALWLYAQEMQDDLMQLLALIRSVTPFMAKNKQAIVWHGENISGTLTLSKEKTNWSDECGELMIPDWAEDWLYSLEDTSDENIQKWFDTKLLNKIKRKNNYYLRNATPQNLIHIENTEYFSDGSNVVDYEGNPLPNANPLTFKRLCHNWQWNFYTDGAGVWIEHTLFRHSRYQIANGLRPEQIHVWSGGYDEEFLIQAGDDLWFFVRGEKDFELKSQRVDSATFQEINYSGYIDKNAYYAWDSGNKGLIKIEGINLSDVIKFNDSFNLAGNNVLYWKGILPNADAKSFHKFSSSLYCDDNHVWYGGSLLEGCDPKSLVLLSERYDFVKDANHVFILGKIIPDADTKTVELLNITTQFYWKDKNHIWYWDRKLASLTLLGDKISLYPDSCYCRVGNRIWCQEKELMDVDVESFVIIDDSKARDKYGSFEYSARV